MTRRLDGRLLAVLLMSLCAGLSPAGQAGRVPATVESDLRFTITRAAELAAGPDSGRLYLLLDPSGRSEPRFTAGRTGSGARPMFARDVPSLRPGATATIDATAIAFPLASLADLPAGEYAVQAVFETNRDLKGLNAPGNLYSTPIRMRLDPANGADIALSLTEQVPPETLPAETDLVKPIRIRSDLLSDFHGRDIFLMATVILPRDFDAEPDRRYPLRVHIGGFGSRHTGAAARMSERSNFRQVWLADDTPRMLFLHLDGAGPLGDPYQVNSANHGPYGDAITRELIPHVEQQFRGIGEPHARVLDGGSTGGWVALALQVFYPDFFNGAWGYCPDSVDFRSFQLINIYEDANAYTTADGSERPGCRNLDGSTRYTMRHECTLENVQGAGDSWSLSGGQWGSWNATYGPRGDDGLPVPLWDPRTGAIRPDILDHWEQYDLRLVLERNWATLGPKLAGKLHIWVGESDNFYLEQAVHRLDDVLATMADPPFEGTITYGEGKGHCWMGISEREMMDRMNARVLAGEAELIAVP